MFGFLSKKDKSEKTSPSSWQERLKSGLGKTRQRLTQGMSDAFLGKKEIDDQLIEQLETLLLQADVGIETTQTILNRLTQQIERRNLHHADALKATLRDILIDLLKPVESPITFNHSPYMILMVGINGAGKTTSIAKIAHYYQTKGKKVLLAAGDTFRAAAVEQLQVWGERNDVPVIAQERGSDSASVLYDGLASAKAKGCDLLLADSAGRLHTQTHLMDELKKVLRVIKKLDESAPHEVMLVLDASIGQNSLIQAKAFLETTQVTGLTLTKLDGSAKGGVLLAIADQLKLPIRFIGIGEGVDDLRPFNAEEFVDALFLNISDKKTK